MSSSSSGPASISSPTRPGKAALARGGKGGGSSSDSDGDEGVISIKFPRTPHLANLGGSSVTHDDLVMSFDDAGFFFGTGRILIVEEKVDGANLGIRIDPESLTFRCQNRAHLVNSATHKQFSGLDTWLSEHTEALFRVLDPPDRYILFGEWLVAKHSIHYTRLPDYFLAFDLFDRVHNRFLSCAARDAKLAGTGIHCVRRIARRAFRDAEELVALLDSPSRFRGDGGFIEGVYVRVDQQRPVGGEGGAVGIGSGDATGSGVGAHGSARGGSRGRRKAAADSSESVAASSSSTGEAWTVDGDVEWGPFLDRRGKLVRSDFLRGIEEHWTHAKLVKNQIDFAFGLDDEGVEAAEGGSRGASDASDGTRAGGGGGGSGDGKRRGSGSGGGGSGGGGSGGGGSGGGGSGGSGSSGGSGGKERSEADGAKGKPKRDSVGKGGKGGKER